MSDFNDEKKYKCPLCGFEFARSDEKCHVCPLASKNHCNVLCCPNCSYSFSEESSLVNWLKKKFGKAD